MSENLIAVLLGVVEGLTEFIPVSSTGHMIIVGHMIGFQGNLAKIFDVVIQLGAILAVLVLYKERFARFLTKEGWQLGQGLSGWHIAAGCVPTMAFAYLVHSFIKKYLFAPATVAVGLVLGAILMIDAEHRIKGRGRLYLHHGTAHHGGCLSVRTAEEPGCVECRGLGGTGHRFCHCFHRRLPFHRVVHEVPAAFYPDRFWDLPHHPGRFYGVLFLSVRDL